MTTLPTVPVQMASSSQQSAQRISMEGRYSDAYLKANFQTTLGGTIKSASLKIGGIITGLALLYALTNNTFGAAFGFLIAILGAAMAGIGWIFGTLISSQGQLLKATLDSAVNTSPFLDDTVRARIMSL